MAQMGHSVVADLINSRPLEFEFGKVRAFCTADINSQGLVRGWSHAEETHIWNDGYDVELVVSARPPRMPVLVRVGGEPYITQVQRAQDITLYANGFRLGFWRLKHRDSVSLSAIVEPEQWIVRKANGLLRFVWHIPTSAKPSELGDGRDDRLLGFCFRSIEIAEAG